MWCFYEIACPFPIAVVGLVVLCVCNPGSCRPPPTAESPLLFLLPIASGRNEPVPSCPFVPCYTMITNKNCTLEERDASWNWNRSLEVDTKLTNDAFNTIGWRDVGNITSMTNGIGDILQLELEEKDPTNITSKVIFALIPLNFSVWQGSFLDQNLVERKLENDKVDSTFTTNKTKQSQWHDRGGINIQTQKENSNKNTRGLAGIQVRKHFSSM